jgi:hypothetical protein
MRAADNNTDESTVEDYNKNVAEHKETHKQSLDWIKTLPNGKIKPILETFPIFEFGRYVSIS